MSTTKGKAAMGTVTYTRLSLEGDTVEMGTQVSFNADPVFAAIQLNAWDYVAPAIRYPISLVRDTSFAAGASAPTAGGGYVSQPPDGYTSFDIEAALATIGGQRLALAQEPDFATRTASNGPVGICPVVTVGATSASTTLAFGDLVSLYFSLNASYRNRPNSCFMASSTTIALISKLGDADNKPIFDPAKPLTIMGEPVVANDYFPTWAAGNAGAIVYGDFKAGYVVRSAGIYTAVLVERHADFLQHALIVAERVDGAPADPKALVGLTVHS